MDYNDGMKGVDVSDQLASSYPTPKKTVKWYHKLFYNIVDMTVVNSHAVHKALGGQKLQLIQQLLGRPSTSGRSRSRTPLRPPSSPAATSSPARRRPSPSPARRRVVATGHTITRVETTAGGRSRYRHCRVTRGARKDSLYFCALCKVGLCPECFDPFHKC